MSRSETTIESPKTPLSGLAGYLHDCVAAQAQWARALNVFGQRDVRIVPLTRSQTARLGRESSLALRGKRAVELGNRHALLGSTGSLVLGALFLVGRAPATADRPARRYCAPLLEVPLQLRRDLGEGRIVVEPDEVQFSVNYGLLAELLRNDAEDLQERLADLADVVPDFPIDAGEFGDFWNGFRMIASGVRLCDGLPERQQRSVSAEPDAPSARREPLQSAGKRAARGDSPLPVQARSSTSHGAASAEARLELVDFYRPRIAQDDQFRMLPAAAIILGPRAARAFSLLEELARMAREPLERTAFAEVFGTPGTSASPSTDGKDAGDVFPLPLTAAQEAAVRSARTAPLTVVTGPPGTGKSYTISAIVLDALLRGTSVLVASQMDKAVEVVANMVERIAGLNSIARSGGRAAQRALAEKITHLTGPRSRLQAVPQSRRRQTARRHAELVSRLRELEQRYRRTVEAERTWSRCQAEYARLAPICPLPVCEISGRRFRRAERAARWAGAALHDDSGMLGRWWGRYQMRRALGLLNVPRDWNCTIEELNEAVRVHGHKQRLVEIEQRLRVPFPADRLWEEIARVEQDHAKAALELLHGERESVLFALTRKQATRQQLRSFRTSLRRRNRKLKRELLEQVEVETLLRAFPCWASSNRTLGQILPPKPGLFDLVVIDEASQCDLGAAAAALLRAKRAVIVGDPNQLRHVCFLGRAREEAAFSRHGLAPEDQQRFRYSRRSLFDVAADVVDQDHFFLLDEHFRSDPHIIDFSNRRFYDGSLRIMTERPRRQAASAIRVRHVAGRRDEGTSVNPREVDAVLEELAAWVDADRSAAAQSRVPSLGVVCPFRDQVDAISEQVLRRFTSAEIDRHGMVVGTAHAFQGDEKDIVILTTSIDTECHPASLRFLENPNLFNVAVTRARRLVVVVTSVTADDLPAGLLRDYLAHAAGTMAPHGAGSQSTSRLSETVGTALEQRGLHLWRGFPAAGFRLDLVAGNSIRDVGILCDTGEPAAAADSARGSDDTLTCHRILARAGWELRRLPERSWQADAFACAEYLAGAVDTEP